MGELSVQQTRQLERFLATHKNVSRQKAIIMLFQGGGGGQDHVHNKPNGLKVERNTTSNATPKQTHTYNVKTQQAEKQGNKLANDFTIK